jgi:hypothetical protein
MALEPAGEAQTAISLAGGASWPVSPSEWEARAKGVLGPGAFDDVAAGSDVLKALALGADGALLGRLFVWGLATGGAAGVEAVIRQPAAELDVTMALSGLTSARVVPRALVTEAAHG